MLTITAADRALATELGLFLVRQAETPDDRALGIDPRATRTPESWTVKETRTHRVVGRLRFTEADSLYASKLTASISGIEETVAAALRWIAPVLRHVRTGQYAGTETIVVPSTGRISERPRALTECGARPTGADHTRIDAESAVVNGEAGDLCPACRDKLAERGVRDASTLSARCGSASPRQRAFLRCLLDEGAQSGRPYLAEARSIDQLSSREASRAIDALKALKARAWKGAL